MYSYSPRPEVREGNPLQLSLLRNITTENMASTVSLNPDDYKVQPLQPLPAGQAINSKTFRPPPLDGSLSLPEIYDWHLANTPHHPVFVYAEDDGTQKTIFWPTVARGMHRAGRIVRDKLGDNASARPVVAILCACGEKA